MKHSNIPAISMTLITIFPPASIFTPWEPRRRSNVETPWEVMPVPPGVASPALSPAA